MFRGLVHNLGSCNVLTNTQWDVVAMVTWNHMLPTPPIYIHIYRKIWKITFNDMGTYMCVWSAKALLPNTACFRITVLIERRTAPRLWIAAVHLLSILQYLATHISHVFFRHATCSQVVLYVIHCRLKELLRNVTIVIRNVVLQGHIVCKTMSATQPHAQAPTLETQGQATGIETIPRTLARQQKQQYKSMRRNTHIGIRQQELAKGAR
jgi:hypothetical protein